MLRLFQIFGIVILCGFFTCEISAQTLIVGAPEWRPWQINEGGQLAGITADVIQELERRTGLTIKVRILPHKRMLLEFETRKIDIEPSVNPAWRADQNDISCYTTAFYKTGDIVLVRKGSGIKGNSVDAFKGLTLGCGLGYYYPEGFQAAFENGVILREDNRIVDNNIIKLILRRIDGAILEKVETKFLLKAFKVSQDKFEIAYEFKPAMLCFRLHKSKQDFLPPLNKAIESMKVDGTIDQIVVKYTQ